MKDADLILDWLEASKFIKQVKQSWQALRAFAKIMSRNGPESVPEMMSKVEGVNRETLRKARVRLDCTVMLLSRLLFAQSTAGRDLPFVYLFTDASPQWRGSELFATSWDWISFVDDDPHFFRKLLPVVSLDRGHIDGYGKTLCILWQIALVVGPTWAAMKMALSRVRAIITDMGVERFIVNSEDCLDAFFKVIRAPIDRAELAAWPRGQYLFPKAVQLPGWKHLWDNLLQRGLSSLRFFPGWLECLKCLVAFLRRMQVRTVLCKHWRSIGLEGVSQMLERTKFPSFAAWRWGTLAECTSSLQSLLATLTAHFDPELFKGAREGSRLDKVCEALFSAVWQKQVVFVHWLCQWIKQIMNYATGCSCHEAELLRGEAVNCWWKGRRLSLAFGFATRSLGAGLEEANSWLPSTHDCGEVFWRQTQGVVRQVCVLAKRKIAFLDQIPYLFARLDEPHVAARCLAQWDAIADARQHHRVSAEMLAPGSHWRPQVEAIQPDASGISPALRQEIRGFQCVPMDDTVAEAPHAAAARIQKAARGCSWPWLASTMRLEQNIADARQLPAACNASLQCEWMRYTSLLQVGKGRQRSRPQRIKPSVFQSRVYTMSHWNEDDDSEENAEDDDGEGGGEDDDDPGDDDHGPQDPHGHVPEGGHAGARRAEQPVEVHLTRQWLTQALQEYDYISVPVLAEEGSRSMQVYQILGVNKKFIGVKVLPLEEPEQEEMLFEVMVQSMDRWRPLAGVEEVVPATVDVFAYADPSSVDILTVTGLRPETRHELIRWHARQSDVEGCSELYNPEPVNVNMKLSNASCPALCILDELARRGFVAHMGLVVHSPTSPLVYDGRILHRKRMYLKALLCLQDLWDGGVLSFKSSASQAFFELMIKTRKPVPAGISAKRCQEMITRAAAGQPLEEVAALAQVPRPCRAPERPLAVADAIVGDDIVGDEQQPLPDPPALPAPPPIVDAGPPGGDEGVVVGDEPLVAVEGPPAAEVARWPREIQGQPVRVVAGRHFGGYSYHDRLQVRCSNAAHHNCTKSRSTQLDLAVHGPRAAEFYLGAWLLQAHLPVEVHRKLMPRVADVREYAASHA